MKRPINYGMEAYLRGNAPHRSARRTDSWQSARMEDEDLVFMITISQKWDALTCGHLRCKNLHSNIGAWDHGYLEIIKYKTI